MSSQFIQSPQPAVLIFDINIESQAKMARLLSDACDLFPCLHVEEALMAIIDTDQKLDLVIINFGQNKDGVRVIACTRSNRSDIPIIVMSDELNRVGIIGPQLPHLLSLPYNPSELHNVVQMALTS